MSEDDSVWRNWPLQQLEREYSPSSCAPDFAAILANYAARSREAERQFTCRKDLKYGLDADETFDFFPAGSTDAPLLVYIHGGYWQELSKDESLFAAPDCVANGIAFAAINYSLAPRVDITTMVNQCQRAISYLYREADLLGFDQRKLYIAGSSAGAHLVAMLLMSGWQELAGLPGNAIAGAVLLSGIYDLEPLLSTYINAPLHLIASGAAALSPMRLLPGKSVPTVIAWGEHETDEFKRQSRSYASRLKKVRFPVSAFEVAGANHFDIVFGLADRTSELGRATLAMIEGQNDALTR